MYLRYQNKQSAGTPKTPVWLWDIKEWYVDTPVLFAPLEISGYSPAEATDIIVNICLQKTEELVRF